MPEATDRSAPLPIVVRDLHKSYGSFTALHSVSFVAEPGKIVALLGPSGCGKTTTLRCIAGLEIPQAGEIRVGEQVVYAGATRTYLQPNHRNMGMVFQSYAIWPHMTVFENIAYPLRAKRTPRGEINQRVEATLEIVGLSGLASRPAGNLSGGQQQRVALGRAIIGRPRVLLFDEPLSNLDAKLRAKMRYEIVRLQRELGLTSIFVTHDQGEAMAIADRIIVMNKGHIEQIGDPRGIYQEPANAFVADFIGSPNLLACTVAGTDQQDRFVVATTAGGTVLKGRRGHGTFPEGAVVRATIRPEAVRLPADGDGPLVNVVEVTVDAAQYLGVHLEVFCRLDDVEFRAWLAPNSPIQAGTRVRLAFEASDCLFIQDAADGGDE